MSGLRKSQIVQRLPANHSPWLTASTISHSALLPPQAAIPAPPDRCHLTVLAPGNVLSHSATSSSASVTQLEDMTVAELKKALQQYGQPISGKKEVLVERLKKAKEKGSSKASPSVAPPPAPPAVLLAAPSKVSHSRALIAPLPASLSPLTCHRHAPLPPNMHRRRSRRSSPWLRRSTLRRSPLQSTP